MSQEAEIYTQEDLNKDIEHDIQQIETDIENVRFAIERLNKLEKLMSTPEWKELIEKGYLRDEAARCVKLKGDIAYRMQGELQMQWIDDMITGIGAFEQFLNFIRQSGSSARQKLDQHQETHAELLKEQMESGIQ